MPDPTSQRDSELLERIASLEKENALLRQKIDLLIRKLFGATSEKLDPAQLLLLLQGGDDAPLKSSRARGRGGATALDGPIASALE